MAACVRGFKASARCWRPRWYWPPIGVLLTALITAPVAKYALDLNWTEALLVGAVVASTDAAAVFLLVHAQGLRLRPASARRWRRNPAPTIRSRYFSR